MSAGRLFSCCKAIALAVSLLWLSPAALAVSPNESGESPPTMKVRVLSFKVGNLQRARAVVQPCAQTESCNSVEVIIEPSTELLDNGKSISLEEAETLTWEYAVIVLNASNTAQMFVRVPQLH